MHVKDSDKVLRKLILAPSEWQYVSSHFWGFSCCFLPPIINSPPNMLSIFPDTTVRFHSGIRGMCYLSEAQRGEVTPREFIVY